MIDRGDQNTRAAYNLSFSKQHAVKSRSPEIRTPLKPKGDRAVDDDFRLRHDAVKLVARRTRMIHHERFVNSEFSGETHRGNQ